jgi:hypothetical protein
MAVLQLGKQFLVENESNIKIVNSESKSIRRRDDDVVIAVCVHGK